jgi:hypothetical protein
MGRRASGGSEVAGKLIYDSIPCVPLMKWAGRSLYVAVDRVFHVRSRTCIQDASDGNK